MAAVVASFWGLNKHNFTSYILKLIWIIFMRKEGEGNKITKCLTSMIITSLHLSYFPQFKLSSNHTHRHTTNSNRYRLIIIKKLFFVPSYLILIMIKSQNTWNSFNHPITFPQSNIAIYYWWNSLSLFSLSNCPTHRTPISESNTTEEEKATYIIHPHTSCWVREKIS